MDGWVKLIVSSLSVGLCHSSIGLGLAYTTSLILAQGLQIIDA